MSHSGNLSTSATKICSFTLMALAMARALLRLGTDGKELYCGLYMSTPRLWLPAIIRPLAVAKVWEFMRGIFMSDSFSYLRVAITPILLSSERVAALRTPVKSLTGNAGRIVANKAIDHASIINRMNNCRIIISLFCKHLLQR